MLAPICRGQPLQLGRLGRDARKAPGGWGQGQLRLGLTRWRAGPRALVMGKEVGTAGGHAERALAVTPQLCAGQCLEGPSGSKPRNEWDRESLGEWKRERRSEKFRQKEWGWLRQKVYFGVEGFRYDGVSAVGA